MCWLLVLNFKALEDTRAHTQAHTHGHTHARTRAHTHTQTHAGTHGQTHAETRTRAPNRLTHARNPRPQVRLGGVWVLRQGVKEQCLVVLKNW